MNEVDLLPHQISALYGSRVQLDGRISSGLVSESEDKLPRGILIADETGLGKTVIIGLYILYLKLGGLGRNVIIAAPKSITTQWKWELLSKANLIFNVINTGKELKQIDKSRDLNIIVSIDLLKTENGMSFLESLKDEQIDVSVIDEAHHVLSYNETYRRKMSLKLREKSKLLLLSTATPFRGNNREKQIIKDLLGENYVYIRRIKEDVKDFQGRPLFEPRKSFLFSINLTAYWDSIYKNLERKIDRLHTQNIVKLVLKKRLASSIYSFAISYEKVLSNKLLSEDEILGETDDFRGKEMDANLFKESTNDLYMKELGIYNYTKDMLEPKEEWLLNNFQQLLQKYGDKVVVFTEYVSTLKRLSSVLKSHRIEYAFVHGEMDTDERFHEIKKFRNNDKIKLLLATDVAGEGLNIQVANIQINYDIPWSPLKLEQRFGRLHRYGQKRIVYLFNLYIESTLDQRIVEAVITKLDNIARRLGDWIFDYVGDLISIEDIREILENNNKDINLNQEKLEEIKRSIASPKDPNLHEIEQYVSKYKYRIDDKFNIHYVLSNIESIKKYCYDQS